jgi:hypothetical protein
MQAAVFMMGIMGGWFLFPQSAAATICQTIQQQQICVVDIQRSAKNYWEYRIKIQVDGVEQSMVIYNCRDRTKTQQNGEIIPFDQYDIGNRICRLFKA